MILVAQSALMGWGPGRYKQTNSGKCLFLLMQDFLNYGLGLRKISSHSECLMSSFFEDLT